MTDKAFQTICSLKNGVCEKTRIIINFEKNAATINPEKCLECPLLEEKVRRSVIILSGSPMTELYKKMPTFIIGFDLQIPKRTIETEQ
ncbi:MAG: hypothetical protein WED07_13940 [Candidatus Freyarchaeum deiterrae]